VCGFDRIGLCLHILNDVRCKLRHVVSPLLWWIATNEKAPLKPERRLLKLGPTRLESVSQQSHFLRPVVLKKSAYLFRTVSH
jgi:hypothetical protein